MEETGADVERGLCDGYRVEERGAWLADWPCEWKGRWNESEIARKRLFDLRECDMEVTDDGVFVMLVEDVAKFAEDIDGVDCFSRPPPGRTLMDP